MFLKNALWFFSELKTKRDQCIHIFKWILWVCSLSLIQLYSTTSVVWEQINERLIQSRFFVPNQSYSVINIARFSY